MDGSEGTTTRLAGWASITLFALWVLAAVGAGILQSRAFPNVADQYVPARIQANVLVSSLGWFGQLAIGTAFFAFSFLLSYHLANPLNMITRIALVAGIVAGVFLVAAGAGGQENIYLSVVYTHDQAGEISRAMGTTDLSPIAAANSWVAGGLRSTSAYAQSWAMVLWSLAALKTKKLPAALNWLGIVAAVLFGLTVWIGPISGPIAFVGLLVWHLWLGISLLRAKRA